MNQTDRIIQLEDEVRTLKAQLESECAKRKDEILLQEDFEKINRHQAILIKALQIMQSAESLSQAMNEMLAEIGKFAGVSRVYVFEKNDSEKTISCTFNWCNTGITHIIDDFQNTPIEVVRPWFEVFDTGNIINTSDINTLNSKISKILKRYGVKSFLDLPLTANGVHYGFVGFDECVCNREWDENEVKLLRSLSQIISATRNRYQVEQKLVMERDRLQAIGNNIPNGALFRRETNTQTNEMRYTYLSDTWKDVTGLDVQKALDDFSYNMNIIFPEDRHLLLNKISESEKTLETYSMEICINHPSGEKRWLQIASHPYRVSGSRIIYDGYVLDVTSRKKVDLELSKYRENLEYLVKERTEELETSIEELRVTGEELQATNEELSATNEELDKYKTQLENMVAEKTVQLITRQKELENLSRRQAILIKVLHIVQTSENLQQAINESLAEIGRYAGVSRVHVFEKSPDETTISNTFGWCNDGIELVIDSLQNIPVEVARSFFEMFDAGIHTCNTDDHILAPDLSEMLLGFNVKSIAVFPLSSGSDNYGFVVFDDCITKRQWNENEVELLKSLSEIISGIKSRLQAETSVLRSHQTMQTLLENVNAYILVTDFETLEIIFVNEKLRKIAGDGRLEGLKCWKVLQLGKDEVCAWCPQKKLIGKKCPTEVYRFEHIFEIVDRYLAIDAMAIEWIDGRKALMEVCFDITDLKMTEIELVKAKEKAEESDKLKSAFLANMSHEIRTPLNAIVGFLNIITSENLSHDRKRNYFNIINNSAEQLVKLIDDIVDVAKIEAKQLNIFPAPTNINQLMNEMLITFETYMQAKKKSHIMLVLDDSGFVGNCIINIDPVRLRQVLNNLIDNAIKFTEKGYVRFGYRQSASDKLEFTVEDTGIGMALDKYEIVFERFWKIGNQFYGGVGLGLNIAHTLVQMMGGDIWLETKEGVGTTFYFTVSYLPFN